jgi:hypothetical protein
LHSFEIFAYHRSQPSRSSSQTGAPVAVGASGEPGTVASAPQAIEISPAKVSDSTVLSKAVADSTLNIRFEHRFSAADFSLWIDDKLAYEHSLRGQTKKRWNPFRRLLCDPLAIIRLNHLSVQ